MTGKLIALLLAALAFTGLGLWGQQQHLGAVKARAEVKALVVQRDAATRALEASMKDGKRKDATNLARQRQINKLAEQSARQQKALNEALKDNRDWADVPVPASVLRALDDPADNLAETGPRVDRASPNADPPRQ